MATSYYDIGTITLTNGSKSVVGNGTGWQMALITGGNLFIEAPGNPLPIATVDSDNAITAELAWTGASGTYAYRLQRDSAYMKALDENSRNLSYLLSEIRNGTLYKYDAAGDFANRAMFDGRPKGYGYLVTIGVDEPEFYVKASAAEGDWSGPFAYGTGPVGPQGPVGFLDFKGDYDPGTAYVANDGVRYNGSSWVALQSTTGNAPPDLPTTENAYWSLIALKGQDGTGIGDMLASVYDPQNRQLPFATFGDASGMAGLRNLIINPLLAVNQRNVSGTVTLAAGAYGHDRFKAGSSGCTYTFATSNGVTTLTISAGSLQQVIEAGCFAGRSGVYHLSWQGTAQGRINSGSYGATGAVSATCNGSANVIVEWGTGTLSLPQFEREFVTDFSGRHPQQELALCQRYCEVGTDSVVTTPPSGMVVADHGRGFRVTKRSIPSITLLSVSFINGAGQSVDNVSENGFRFIWTASAAGLSQMIATWVADVEL